MTLQPVKLSRSYKFVWGIAALGTSLLSGIYGALLPIFYQDYLGLSSRWIGMASFIYAIWNALNDPLFGYITDNTRSRWGRRIPYMRFTAPFLALTFVLVWLPPAQARESALFWWMLVTMLLYDTCYTIVGLVYSALLPEVTESDAERNDLQVSSSLFGLLGTLLGFMIPDFFRPKAGGSADFLPLQMSMVAVAVIAMLLIIATTLKVKERPEFTRVDQPIPLGEAIRFTLVNRSFLVLVAANFMSILMQSLLLGAIYYMADYLLQMNTLILLACIFIPLIIGVPLTRPIRERFGVVGAQQLLLIIAGVGLVLITIAPTFLIPICIAVAGFGLSGPQTLTNVLFAQVADEDELRSGVRREGAFFGVNALITKPAQSVALYLFPRILEATNFVSRGQNAGEIFLNQPESALFGIRLLGGLIPGVALLVGAGLLAFFPLRGEYLKKIQQAVLELHLKKKEQLG
ncbi:MFS transporter [Anaerolinea thermophila]|uniref:Major facilitator superfamily transporter n=1 Tax=Anaerolinea thermophila (strain DSM 14523 / JCM 11388 / NBRC 100420 / UNI-1) TaxID=926569 RepID=E8MY29_ANATU|nr:MFS transporter [Anaerolinea thermophila]BAJ64260.1 putative major facilitator superfamily transporter [Anaerolinea thermophila UNI-1]